MRKLLFISLLAILFTACGSHNTHSSSAQSMKRLSLEPALLHSTDRSETVK